MKQERSNPQLPMPFLTRMHTKKIPLCNLPHSADDFQSNLTINNSNFSSPMKKKKKNEVVAITFNFTKVASEAEKRTIKKLETLC